MNLVVKKQGIAKVPQFIDVKWANVTSIFSLIFVFAKTVLIPKKILGAFVLIMIFLIGSLAIVPYYFSYTASTNLSLFLISSFIYGSIFYSFRKSTLFDNIRETNLSKMDIYFSIFVVMFLFTAISYLFIIFFFVIGLAVDSTLFMDDWFFAGSDYSYGSGGHLVSQLSANLLVWWFIAFILLNFSIFYLFQNITNSQKTFYLFVFFYLVLLLLYGNAIIAPSLSHQNFVIADKYPNYSTYITISGITWRNFLTTPDADFPFDSSFYIKLNSGMLKAKFENGQYFSAIMTLLTPHYWINMYSANVMKATCLSEANVTLATNNNRQLLEILQDEFGFTKYKSIKIIKDVNSISGQTVYYSVYSFKDAKIWSFQNDIAWILGMYLWMAYFVLFYLSGRFISKLIYYSN